MPSIQIILVQLSTARPEGDFSTFGHQHLCKDMSDLAVVDASSAPGRNDVYVFY